jgi:tetratricopeptide (TPR) repeat protein
MGALCTPWVAFERQSRICCRCCKIDLARCLVAQGRFPEAEELIDKVLPEMQDDLAARGADYAIALYEKARVRRLQGDVAAATELLQKVLRLQERAYDREHPTLLLTLAELGAALIEMRKPREAEPLLRRAVRLAEKVRDRPALTEALGDLARAQAAQGFAHARDPARRALYMWDAAEVEPPPALRRELEAIAAGSSAPSRRP